ncbi:MAG: hypothetical protein AB1744_00900 [Candidatus Zixiibacteriota bacterium]
MTDPETNLNKKLNLIQFIRTAALVYVRYRLHNDQYKYVCVNKQHLEIVIDRASDDFIKAIRYHTAGDSLFLD